MKKTSFLTLLLLVVAVFTLAGNCTSVSADENGDSQANGKITGINYDIEDWINVETDKPDTTIWVAVIKKEEGVTLQKKDFKSYKSERHGLFGDYEAYFSLNDSKKGFKLATNKDAYLYITDTEPVNEKKEYTPNYILYASPTLSKVELDYVAASTYHDYSTPVITRFTIKDGSDFTVYSKAENSSAFFEAMSHLAYAFCYDNEKFAGYLVYDKDDHSYEINREASTAPQNIWMDRVIQAEGKIVYEPQDVTGNIRNDIENGENWTVKFDQAEKNRLVRYTYEMTVSGEGSESEKDEKLRNSYLHSVWYSEESGWEINNNSFYNSSRSGIIYKYATPEVIQAKYALGGKKFVYLSADAESDRKAGMYLASGNSDTAVTPLVNLETYGLGVNTSYWDEDEKIQKEMDLTGLSLVFEEMEEAVTAADFGIRIRGYSKEGTNLAIKMGDYFKISKYPYYGFNTEELGNALMCMAEGEKTMLYMCYAGKEKEKNKSAYRSGKLTKVSLKKPAKAVKIKADVNKDTIALKNGLDYSFDCGETWYTILPFNKNGTAPSAIIPTENYTPAKKADDDPKAFTSEKVKGISIEKFLEENDGGFSLSVRKSAKIGAPASQYNEEGLYFDGRDGAPVIDTLEKNPLYLSVADDKDNLKLPKIAEKNDYEYIIVSGEDFTAELSAPGTIVADSMKWSKYKNDGKGKITVDKTKSKYRLKSEDKADNHVLTEGSYVLIRVKGKTVKGKGKDATTEYYLASDYYTAKVEKATVEDHDRYVLVPANTKIRFVVDYGYGVDEEKIRTLTIPRGGSMRSYQIPSRLYNVSYEASDAGYALVGWTTDPESDTPNVDEKTKFKDAEVSLYAILKQDWISYTVKFAWNYEGAEEEFYAIKDTDRNGYVSFSQDPQREGNEYRFGGWYLNPECTGDAVNIYDSVFTKDTVLYAKWDTI